MGRKRATADFQVIAGADGNRYRFYCGLSGALVCTTGPYRADTPEEELLLAWETEGKPYFNECRGCGRYVSNVMYNVEIWECVECAPYEVEAKFCKNCGAKLDAPGRICPRCGRLLMYPGKEIVYGAEKARYDTLEAFGFGPNVMRKTAVCAQCGRMADAGASACPACGGQMPEETLYDCYKRQHACCPACDTVLSPGSRYCPNCGKRVFGFGAGRRQRAGRP